MNVGCQRYFRGTVNLPNRQNQAEIFTVTILPKVRRNLARNGCVSVTITPTHNHLLAAKIASQVFTSYPACGTVEPPAVVVCPRTISSGSRSKESKGEMRLSILVGDTERSFPFALNVANEVLVAKKSQA